MAKESKFKTYSTEHLIDDLEMTPGAWAVTSNFKGAGYVFKDDTIVILGGKNGMLSIGLIESEAFMKEFKEMVDLAKFRKRNGFKGTRFQGENK